MPPTRCAISIGSNLGDRRRAVEDAFSALDAIERTALVARSGVHETAPVGPPGQGPYLNAAAIVGTTLGARALLDAMLAIEAEHGRDRSREPRWGARTLDLDLLTFGDAVIDEPGLTVPHPRMHERLFVLGPLREIAPGLVIPGRSSTVLELFEALPA